MALRRNQKNGIGRLGRRSALVSALTPLALAIPGGYFEARFVPSDAMYAVGLVIGAIVYIVFVGSFVLVAATRNLSDKYYAYPAWKRPAVWVGLFLGGGVLGLMSLQVSITGVGGILHQTDFEPNHSSATYKIIRKVNPDPRLPGGCTLGFEVVDYIWPVSARVCGVAEADWRQAEPGMALWLSGTKSKYGLQVYDYKVKSR